MGEKKTERLIPLEEIVPKWDGEKYALLYLGVRSWGYKTKDKGISWEYVREVE